MRGPEVSAVLVNYNAGRELGRALQSIADELAGHAHAAAVFVGLEVGLDLLDLVGEVGLAPWVVEHNEPALVPDETIDPRVSASIRRSRSGSSSGRRRRISPNRYRYGHSAYDSR